MRRAKGFSLVELMVAMVLGIIVMAGVITVFLAQRRVYLTTSSQGGLQDSQNAISSIVGASLRGAGFLGCGSFRHANSIIKTGASSLVYNFTAPVFGFDAKGTGSGGAYAITQINAADSSDSADWVPSLDSTLVGKSEPGSDIIVVGGEKPGTQSVPASSINNNVQFTIPDSSYGTLPAGTAAAISDCAKSTVFQITSMSSSSNIHNVHHTAGGGGSAPGNSSGSFQPQYKNGSQFVELQQVAYMVARGDGGQSSLYQAVMKNGAWDLQPLVPGVDSMQVLYGIGPESGGTTQYVSADDVGQWTQVNSVRIGFLLEGALGSGIVDSNPTQWDVLGTTVTVPKDTRLRHVFVMTVNLRNVTL